MEYLEIVLTDVNRQFIDLIIRQELKITDSLVTSSHFFNQFEKKDVEYSEISSLVEYFSTTNTGNIFVKKLEIGETLANVMVVMSFNDGFGDITLTFEENEISATNSNRLKNKIVNIISRLAEIQQKYSVKNIKMGYESVVDNENLILTIFNQKVTIVNKFNNQFCQAINLTYV